MDFVSNSSSSSFVLKTQKNMLDKSTYEKFLTFFTSGEKLDEYNVEEYVHNINSNIVWSIFEFHFMTNLNNDNKYEDYYNIPPMECLDTVMQEDFDEILSNIFKDKEGGFKGDGCFFYHEDFVFQHRGIAQITFDSIEYTRKILKMIKDNGWDLEPLKEKYCIIENHLVKEKYKDKEGEDRERATRYKTIEEAEAYLDKLEEELLNDVNYIVIAMSYSGDGTCNGKLWYDRDWREKEKSCYELIKENNFGDTIYIDW
jgi:hypothetical protein